jgi:hypothetical protein
LLWGDDAMYQRVLALGTWDVHPVWGALGRLFFARLPWGDFAFRANLASAVYAVGTIGFLFLATLTLSGSLRAALSAGAILAISHIFWLESVRAEVYTLNMLLFFGGLWALFRWRQAPTLWFWLLLGLAFWWVGIVNHLLLALSLPGGLLLFLGTFSGASSADPANPAGRSPAKDAGCSSDSGSAGRSTERKRAILVLLLALLIGGLLFVLFVPNSMQIILGALSQVLRTTPLSISPRRLSWHLMILAYQFPVFVLLAIPGVSHLWQRDRSAVFAMGVMALLPAVFAATYGSLESYVLYLPALGLVACCAGVGAAVVTVRWSRARWFLVGTILIALQIGLYRITPIVVDHLAPGIIPARNLPGRQASSFFLWPPKRGYHGARQFAEAALDVLPANALLVSDWTITAPLHYLQDVEGQRRDVLLVQVDSSVMQTVRENTGRRPLFLANADPRYYPMDEIEQLFQVQAVGSMFALVPRLKDGETGMPRLKDGETGMPRLKDGETGMPRLKDGETGMPRLKDGETGMPRLKDGETRMPRLKDGETGMPR